MDQKPQPYPLPPENPRLGLSPVRSGPFAARNADTRYAEHLRDLHDLIRTIATDVSTTKEDFEDLSTRSRDNGQALERLMLEIKGVREDDGVSQKLTGLAQLDHLQKLDKLRYLGKLNKLDSIEETLRGLQAPPGAAAADKSPELEQLEQLGQLSQLDQLSKLGELEKLGQLRLLEHLAKLQSLENMESRLDKLQELDRLQELQNLQQLKHLEHLADPRTDANLAAHFDELKALHSDTSKRLERLPTTIEEQLRLSGADQTSSMSELKKQLDALAQAASVQELTDQVRALHTYMATNRERGADERSQQQQQQRVEESHVVATVESIKTGQKELFEALGAKMEQRLAAVNELSSGMSKVSTSLHELSHLGELSKLQSLDKLHELDGLAALEELKALKQLSELSRLDDLAKLDALRELDELKSLSKLEQLDQLQQLSELKPLARLDELTALQKLGSLDQLAALEQLGSLKALSKLDGLDKLGALDSLASLGQIEDIRGEIRAVQDHLVGMHKDAVQELAELRRFKEEAGPAASLSAEAQELEARVKRLRDEERELQSSTAALKAELRTGVDRLADCEARYTRLESQLRELTLAKYKGILGTGAMAVLSKSQNKENELVMPKRQLRTVSLANH